MISEYASEEDFQDAVAHRAQALGWLVYHGRKSMQGDRHLTAVKYDGVGYVDLTLVHPAGWFLFLELKSHTGRFSDNQIKWRNAISSAAEHASRVAYFTWKPKDWAEIEQVLATPRNHSLTS